MPRQLPPNELPLLARQLIRFNETGHPNTNLIIQTDIDAAHRTLLAAPSSTTTDLIPFPLTWAESARTVRTFLRAWRRVSTRVAPATSQTAQATPAVETLREAHPAATSTTARPAATPTQQAPANSNLPQTPPNRSHGQAVGRDLQRLEDIHDAAFPTPQEEPGGASFLDARNTSSPSTLSSPRDPSPRQDDRQTTLALLQKTPSPNNPTLSSSSHSAHSLTPDSVRLDQIRNTQRLQNLSLDAPPRLSPSAARTTTSVQTPFLSTPYRNAATQTDESPGFLKSFLKNMSAQADQTFAADLIAAAFERQKSDITQIVAQTIKALQQEDRHHDLPNGPTPARTFLKSDEVGFFNPSLQDSDGSGAIASGKQTIYTDVWAFTDRLSHLAALHGDDKVKAVWTTCLQGTALSWHTTELTDLEKTALQGGDSALICQTLRKRFRVNHSDALHSLQQSRFSLYDLAQGKPIRVFVQKIIRDAKACDYSVKNQLLAAFEAMDPEIQSQLTKPSDATTVGLFLAQIDDRESILLGKARQMFPNPSPLAVPTLSRRARM